MSPRRNRGSDNLLPMVGQARVADESVRLLGRYALHGEIAVGGMATIHVGRLLGASGFSRTVAIKRLHKQFARDPEFVSMFLDEARLAARVRHPNVLPTLDVVSTEGELFVVMEYVHGESLSALIRSQAINGHRIPTNIAAAILSATLQGLHAAHEARDEHGKALSIVHRDVSPHNVLVGADGVARVLDFGIAKAAGRIHTTRNGELKGKLPYMAPEQLMGEEITRQVDVYSASVCLWEAFTGRRLFSGKNEGEVLNQVLLSEVPTPSSYAPDLPPAVDEVVLRGLSRDVSRRFATARDMSIALEKAMVHVANAREISDWMDGTVGNTLALRLRRVEAVEQQTGAPSSEYVLREPSPEPKSALDEERARASDVVPASGTRPLMDEQPFDTSQAWLTLAARRDRLKKRVLMVLAATSVLLLLLAYVTHRQDASPAPVVSKDIAPPSAPTPIPQVSVDELPRSPSPPSPAPPAVEASAKSVRIVAPKASAPPPAAKNGCNPPYFFDSSGRKRYKRECF